MKKKIAVIGAGFGGLAAANRLLAAGHEVHLFDKRDKTGGRGYQYEIDGFLFDGGPTVITAPHLFDDIFDLFSKKSKDYFELMPLDPFYRVFHHDGRFFDYRHKTDDMLKEIEKWSPKDSKGYKKFVKQTRKLFDALYPFTDQPVMTLSRMLSIMPDVIRLHGWLDTYRFVSLYLKDSFLRKVFAFHPLLIGGNPLNTPALFTLIMEFERRWGVHYARGGTGAIVKGLTQLFQEHGGHVHLNSEISEIQVENKKVQGLQLKDKSSFTFDAVVSNGDSATTYKNLIKSEHRTKWTDRKIENKKYSNSLFVIYFGTKKRYLDSKFDHHNIIFGKEYKKLLRQIFNKQELPDEMALYLHMPTITDSSIAPEGCESFYVLSLVPHLDGTIDWKEKADEYREKVLIYLEENYLPDLRENIIATHFIDPLHFENDLNSYKGASFSMQPTLLQSAYFRPHPKSEDIENLYIVGASAHPGAGVPAVISSAKIVADIIAGEK